MTKTKKGKVVSLLSGTVLVALITVAVWLAWDPIRFRWLFEPLEKNGQGYPEYRHRETGIIFVRLPGGKFFMGSPEDEKHRLVNELFHEVTLSPVVIDHFSRRVQGFAVFPQEPTSVEVRAFLGRVIGAVGKAPKFIISDKGGQFLCPGFERWARRKTMEPRYASTGSLRATAVIERFLRSLKDEMLRRISVPLRREAVRRQISLYLSWYHEFRPHQGLGGMTPTELYDGLRPANTKARFEPRPNWPKGSPCALPYAKRRKRCPQLALVVQYLDGNRNLPIVKLKAA